MTAKLLEGKKLAAIMKKMIADEITSNFKHGKRPPGLAVILVGNDPASEIYVRNKRQACEEIGIRSIYHPLAVTATEMDLIDLIHRMNEDPIIDGILVQLPLPAHIDTTKIIEAIHPEKDVDGFHPYNMGRLAQRRPILRPCTPYGITMLLDNIGETYENRHAVVIGASNIVGRPMALELLMAGCTVTICHGFTQGLEPFVKQADILVSAVGKPHLIKGEWIKPGATVIDVGINRLEDGSLIGDIEFEDAKDKAEWITPVPGGVGPMTVATLMKNTLLAYQLAEKRFG